MLNRTLKEVLADHNIKPLTDTERNLLKWKHLRASTSYPRYCIDRYGQWIFPLLIIMIAGGLISLIFAGISAGIATMFAVQAAAIVSRIGILLLILAAVVFLVSFITDECCYERPVYWSQRLDHTDAADRKRIPEDVIKHIDNLTHPMGSGVTVSIEGDSTAFADCILVHHTCWVSKDKPLQIEAIASWEVPYKIPDN